MRTLKGNEHLGLSFACELFLPFFLLLSSDKSVASQFFAVICVVPTSEKEIRKIACRTDARRTRTIDNSRMATSQKWYVFGNLNQSLKNRTPQDSGTLTQLENSEQAYTYDCALRSKQGMARRPAQYKIYCLCNSLRFLKECCQ